MYTFSPTIWIIFVFYGPYMSITYILWEVYILCSYWTLKHSMQEKLNWYYIYNICEPISLSIKKSNWADFSTHRKDSSPRQIFFRFQNSSDFSPRIDSTILFMLYCKKYLYYILSAMKWYTLIIKTPKMIHSLLLLWLFCFFFNIITWERTTILRQSSK